MRERWEDIFETPHGAKFRIHYYRISDKGNVQKVHFSTKEAEDVVPTMQRKQLCFMLGDVKVELRRMVARLFVAGYTPKCAIDFADGDPTNCASENLICYSRKFGRKTAQTFMKKSVQDEVAMIRCKNPNYLPAYSVQGPDGNLHEVVKTRPTLHLMLIDLESMFTAATRVWRPTTRSWSEEVPSISLMYGVTVEEAIRQFLLDGLRLKKGQYRIYDAGTLYGDIASNMSKSGLYYVVIEPGLSIYRMIMDANFDGPIGNYVCIKTESLLEQTKCLKTAYLISQLHNFIEKHDLHLDQELDEVPLQNME